MEEEAGQVPGQRSSRQSPSARRGARDLWGLAINQNQQTTTRLLRHAAQPIIN